MSPKTFTERYFPTDGSLPLYLGGVYAILVAVFLELIAISVLYLGAVHVEAFTQQDFRMYGTLVVALAMFGSYFLYLEQQVRIRTSRTYLGFKP